MRLFVEFATEDEEGVHAISSYESIGEAPPVIAPMVGDRVHWQIGNLDFEGTVKQRNISYKGTEGKNQGQSLSIEVTCILSEYRQISKPAAKAPIM